MCFKANPKQDLYGLCYLFVNKYLAQHSTDDSWAISEFISLWLITDNMFCYSASFDWEVADLIKKVDINRLDGA